MLKMQQQKQDWKQREIIIKVFFLILFYKVLSICVLVFSNRSLDNCVSTKKLQPIAFNDFFKLNTRFIFFIQPCTQISTKKKTKHDDMPAMSNVTPQNHTYILCSLYFLLLLLQLLLLFCTTVKDTNKSRTRKPNAQLN